MRIAVNTRLLLPGKLEGIGWFTYETLQRIVRSHPEHEFHFLFDRPYSREFLFGPNVTGHVIPPPARHPLLWYLWFEWSLPGKLKRIKPDVFLSPDGFLSLKCRVKTLMVMHDIAFEHMPQNVPLLVRWYYRHFSPRYAAKATRILTVSEFSRKDIAERYSVPLGKIDVAPNGVSNIFQPLSQDEQLAIRSAWTDGLPFFLFVSALQPRKNLPGLLKAFDRFRARNPEAKVKLLIVGSRYKMHAQIEKTLKEMKFAENVVMAGHMDRETLAAVTASAMAMAYVSYLEGFGIPILEAMKSGTPVICSNTSSMPEVAGGAALLVNPHNPDDMANALEKIWKNSNLRTELVRKGLARARDFTWNVSAEKVWQALMKTVDS